MTSNSTAPAQMLQAEIGTTGAITAHTHSRDDSKNERDQSRITPMPRNNSTSSTKGIKGAKTTEDPLAYLPSVKILSYRNGQVIYGPSAEKPMTEEAAAVKQATGTQAVPTVSTVFTSESISNHLYLVIDGKVKVARTTEANRSVVVDIYHTEEFFGESALLFNLPDRTHHWSEQAVALGNVRVMAWPARKVVGLMEQSPKLAIGLLQMLLQRADEFADRIESFSLDNVEHRLARALLRFADKFGVVGADPSVAFIMPLTHELLAHYVGTSREIVTHYMNQFRRQGKLRYSRKGIAIEQVKMWEWLQQG